ncbi:MAG TPA: GTP-binding protein [Bacteroidales bacterium]|jgi:sulfate adenylyltransferase subunit 1|nr:GTP-binding protein [Bacteroidota bacterium]HOE59392.1 GTP-binding protein [Bacteroidales bacterium]HOR05177.1 GTP-binding protein [Bacteroidales bacterium]HOU35071.1 GTP-binding protein [Bacteroidales bacterium]HPA29236.1 GTP-binding protein [Bacteroidales bacterium]
MEHLKKDMYLDMELLRFTTAGSVDDGKSTLIGRLLYDSKSIFEDQLEAVKNVSNQKGDHYLDLALFTDGLRSERQQGITIDVAYRYFYTPKRKFIIADTPGHIQYTRNMVTGASTANAAVILVDARNGITEQTLRHYYIAYLLGIKSIIVCINKMDLVNYSSEPYFLIQEEIIRISQKLPVANLIFIPISALKGDNVVKPSANTPWYSGQTLMQTLEAIPIYNHSHRGPLRVPVQYVIRPMLDEFHDYRGYAGRIESGTIRKGDKVMIMPSYMLSEVTSVHLGENFLEEAYAPLSVALTLKDDLDLDRGCFICQPEQLPQTSSILEVMICWFNMIPMKLNQLYTIRQSTWEAKCKIIAQHYKINFHTLSEENSQEELKMNEIGRFTLKTSRPMVFDKYSQIRSTGSFILIDDNTNETIGAGMIQ